MKKKSTIQVPRLAYSVDEAAVAAHVGRESIIKAINAGELSVKRIGGTGRGSRILVPVSALTRWLDPSEGSHAA